MYFGCAHFKVREYLFLIFSFNNTMNEEGNYFLALHVLCNYRVYFTCFHISFCLIIHVNLLTKHIQNMIQMSAKCLEYSYYQMARLQVTVKSKKVKNKSNSVLIETYGSSEKVHCNFLQ